MPAALARHKPIFTPSAPVATLGALHSLYLMLVLTDILGQALLDVKEAKMTATASMQTLQHPSPEPQSHSNDSSDDDSNGPLRKEVDGLLAEFEAGRQAAAAAAEERRRSHEAEKRALALQKSILSDRVHKQRRRTAKSQEDARKARDNEKAAEANGKALLALMDAIDAESSIGLKKQGAAGAETPSSPRKPATDPTEPFSDATTVMNEQPVDPPAQRPTSPAKVLSSSLENEAQPTIAYDDMEVCSDNETSRGPRIVDVPGSQPSRPTPPALHKSIAVKRTPDTRGILQRSPNAYSSDDEPPAARSPHVAGGFSSTGTPRPTRLDEAGLRKLLGGRVELPIVQVFINLMEPALRCDMIQDLKQVVDRHPETHEDFGELVDTLRNAATSWCYDAQRQAVGRKRRQTARGELSWNNYHYNGAPHRSGGEGLLPNFGYGQRWSLADERRVWGSGVERAFLRTKFSRTKGVDLSTLKL